MYKIIAINSTTVNTNKGKFKVPQFKFGVEGLAIGKYYSFDMRGSSILAFNEVPSPEDVLKEEQILEANKAFQEQNPPNPQ